VNGMTTTVVAPEESGFDEERRNEDGAIWLMCERLLAPPQIDALWELLRLAEKIARKDERRNQLLELRGWFLKGEFEEMRDCVRDQELLYRRERDLVLEGRHGYTPYALTLQLSRIPKRIRLPRPIEN